MKSFLVLLSGKQKNLFNENLLAAHIEYLKTLKAQGYLHLCGPFVDDQCAILILKASSEQIVKELIQRDPFIQEQYYQKWAIHEFTEANESNHWLAI